MVAANPSTSKPVDLMAVTRGAFQYFFFPVAELVPATHISPAEFRRTARKQWIAWSHPATRDRKFCRALGSVQLQDSAAQRGHVKLFQIEEPDGGPADPALRGRRSALTPPAPRPW